MIFFNFVTCYARDANDPIELMDCFLKSNSPTHILRNYVGTDKTMCC